MTAQVIIRVGIMSTLSTILDGVLVYIITCMNYKHMFNAYCFKDLWHYKICFIIDKFIVLNGGRAEI